MSVATDYKISDAEKNAAHVEAQPTILQGSPQQNKHAFDAYPDLLMEKHNGLCEFIEANVGAEVDNEVLALFIADGWTPEN